MIWEQQPTKPHGYYLVLRLHENKLVVNFLVVQESGYPIANGKPDYTVRRYRAKDGSGMQLTSDIDDAEPEISGFIKFDGCTQFWFDGEGPGHADTRADLDEQFELIRTARREAARMMGKRWQGGEP